MTVAEILAGYIPFAVPIITIGVALPLVLQRVPPNIWYGFRTRRTLSDEQVWYRANYLGGLDLMLASVAALLVNLVVLAVAPPEIALAVGAAVVVITSGAALVIWALQMKRL